MKTALVCLCLIFSSTLFAAEAELRKAASWQWPPLKKIESQLKTWLEQQPKTWQPREAIEEQLSRAGNVSNGPQFLEHFLSTIAMLDERFQRVIGVESGSSNDSNGSSIDISWLDESTEPWIRANLRLAVATALGATSVVRRSFADTEGVGSS